MRQGTSRTLAGVFLACLAFIPAAGAAVPEWVRQSAAQTLPPYSADTKAVVLLQEATYTIVGPGETMELHRRVVKIMRPEGRNEGDLAVRLQGKDKVSQIHAWTIDKFGHEYELKDKDFIERGDFLGFELYSDLHMRAAKAPAADPGSVVAFEYEVHKLHWLNQLHWFIQEDIPVHVSQMTLSLPVAWEYKTAWFAFAPTQPVSVGANRWQWSLHDLPAIEDEPRMPSPGSLAARMEIAYYGPADGPLNVGSWSGLGRWYTGLTTNRREPSPEISEKARQLIAGKTDFDGKVRALALFLQSDVRYVAISIGIGGYQPHPAADIFHARYGDCKDKATLLSSMLQQAGITAHYVLIDTDRGTVHPDVPSSLFDHAIVAIELPDAATAQHYHSVVTAKSGKQYLIFDPTDEYTPLGELSADLQSTYALLVTPDGGELIRTPLLAPETNLLSRSGHFKLNSDGTLSGEVLETLTGYHARRERSTLVHSNQQERANHFERNLNHSLRGFTLEGTDVQQLTDFQKDLQLKLKFTSPQYGQLRGPLMLLRPRVIGQKSFLVETKPRHYPFEFQGTSREVDSYEIEIPQDYKVDDVPDPIKIDMGFASYQSKVDVEGSKVRYTRELIVRDTQVPADHVSDLRKFEGLIGGDEESAVVLKRQ